MLLFQVLCGSAAGALRAAPHGLEFFGALRLIHKPDPDI